MTRIQHFLRRFYHEPYRNFAHNDIYLDLWQQIGLDLYASVVFGLAFLSAAAKHVRYSHSRDAYIHHRVLERFKPGFFADDLHLRKLG